MAAKFVNSKDISFSNALRAFLCMLPMSIAFLTGYTSFLVPFGQAGFFNSTMPVQKSLFERLVAMFLMLAPGMGFYLLGGNSAAFLVLSVVCAFIVAFSCALLTGWRYLGMVALAGYMPIYSAGLNSGSAEKASSMFIAFSVAILWCGIVSLLPFWKVVQKPLTVIQEDDRVILGFKLGFGTSIALFLGQIFEVTKLGWAPSAISSVVRTDTIESKKRAWIRASGVIGGAIVAGLILYFSPQIGVAIVIVLALSVINGALAYTKFGQIPLLYNAVILILYSQTGSTPTKELIDTRILYNLVGILIGLFFVYYPLPYIAPKIRAFYRQLREAQ